MKLCSLLPLAFLAAATSAALERRQTAAVTTWSAAASETATAAWSTSTAASSSTTACNNSPKLCSKAYNSVLHLGTHDAPFLRTAANNWATGGNQYHDVKSQLSAGVRMIQAQMQLEDTGPMMCHTSCRILSAGTLTAFLTDIREWVDENPNEGIHFPFFLAPYTH